nr:S-adenosyl-L-methionine-dependent methyltransferases superfamily protein [Tanacetum cinerariifolium]
RDERLTTQNSGICSPGPDGETYYGQLQEILEFSLNDLDNATLQIDGQSMEVDARQISLICRQMLHGPTAVRIVPRHTMYSAAAGVASLTE